MKLLCALGKHAWKYQEWVIETPFGVKDYKTVRECARCERFEKNIRGIWGQTKKWTEGGWVRRIK